MKKHNWALDDRGEIDHWRVDYGFHNGPECLDCGWVGCEHCYKKAYGKTIYQTKCKGKKNG